MGANRKETQREQNDASRERALHLDGLACAVHRLSVSGENQVVRTRSKHSRVVMQVRLRI